MSVLLRRKKPSFPPCQCEVCSPSSPIEGETSPDSPDHQSDGFAGDKEEGGDSPPPQELPRQATCDCCYCYRCDCCYCYRCRSASESEDTGSASPSDSDSSRSGSEEDSEEEQDEGTRAKIAEIRAILHRLYEAEESEEDEAK